MAVQLPALRKIGEELGVSLDDGMSGIVDSGRKQNQEESS